MDTNIFEEAYQKILNTNNIAQRLHEICPHREQCWGDLLPKEKDALIWNDISLPYIGSKFSGKLLCVGINFNGTGGLNAASELITGKEGVKKSLANQNKKMRFGNPPEIYSGTQLFHNLAVYANVLLGNTHLEGDELLSVNNKNIYDDFDVLSSVWDELIYLNAVKCSPDPFDKNTERSKPTEIMKMLCPKNILQEEIKLISPDNILILSVDIYNSLRTIFTERTEAISEGRVCEQTITVNEKQIKLFCVPHPSAFGGNSRKIGTDLAKVFEKSI
ncbi:MAG: hypothetical protein Ta2B_13840 [Termitinemataceae bacterium]|nr:MAG: hypothetical protein Ta2B_13840 [Termitinemataceae bacterium]